MKISNKRIAYWIISLTLVAVITLMDKYEIKIESPFKERLPITVNAPKEMEKAFKDLLEDAKLEHEYRIVINNDENANIIVDYSKQDDNTYMKFAFSPFIIAYNPKDKYEKAFRESELLIPSKYDEDNYEIDLLKIINEAIGEGQWSNLGIKELKNIKIFYPSKNTPYWHDFYNFMLVTVNNGVYPSSTEELEEAEKYIDKFFESEYTEEVTDFQEKVNRVGGFPENSFYVIPEKTAIELTTNINKNSKIFYPTETVYFYYYIKGDELGNKLIDLLKKESDIDDFYEELSYKDYRNFLYSNISLNNRCLSDRNEYNVVDIP